MSGVTLTKRPRDVAAMFDALARRYDTTNTVISLGLDHHWRRRTRQALELHPGERVLDLAAGTGTSTVELALSGAYTVGCDFSLGMLRTGNARGGQRQGRLVAGDALQLPFRDGAFDAATIAFGLRNIADPGQALREMARVVRPGGRLVVCEFSLPSYLPLRRAYLSYLSRGMPTMVRRLSSSPDAYTYLAESIRSWPGQLALARQIAAAGWVDVHWRNLTGGIVALHRAERVRSSRPDLTTS